MLRVVRPLCVALVLAAMVAAGACGTSGRDLRQPAAGGVGPTRSTSSLPPSPTVNSLATANQMLLASPAFESGGAIPAELSCTGPSPALIWTGIPADVKELALVVTDPTADNYVHWIVTGIAPKDASIAKGQVPPEATQRQNSAGKLGWLGPCPPKGPDHTYNFTLYALPERTAIAAGTAPKDVIATLQQSAQGRLTILSGTFGLGDGAAGTSAPASKGTLTPSTTKR